jgi:hypothetical protein
LTKASSVVMRMFDLPYRGGRRFPRLVARNFAKLRLGR